MKPILFSTEMVQAILEGRKTVTRQVINPQPERAHMVLDCNENERAFEFMCGSYKNGIIRDWSEMVKAPYWPGDVLWVREQFYVDYLSNIPGTGRVRYEDGTYMDITFDVARYGLMRRIQLRPGLVPATSMPREAARIFIRVADIHPERLNTMILEDVEKEGLELLDDNILNLSCMSDELWNRWINTWNSTIKPADLSTYGWDANPWVWVIQFERISEGEAKGER